MILCSTDDSEKYFSASVCLFSFEKGFIQHKLFFTTLDYGDPFTSTKYTVQRAKNAHMQVINFRQLLNFNPTV